jgi:hypothetical protein
MNVILSELFTVLEDQLAAGRELLQNLERQKRAIVEWDLIGLMEQLREKERWLRTLEALEQQRASLVTEIVAPGARPFTLRELVKGTVAQDDADRWEGFRRRAHETFARLLAGERDLAELMENITLHIQEALSPSKLSSAAVYGETGTAASQRPSAGLIAGRV